MWEERKFTGKNVVRCFYVFFWLWWMSMAICENAQLFTANQPPTKSQAVKKKEKKQKKKKKKQKKAMEISTPMRDTSELPSNAFRPIDWVIGNWDGFFELSQKSLFNQFIPEMIFNWQKNFGCLSYKVIWLFLWKSQEKRVMQTIVTVTCLVPNLQRCSWMGWVCMCAILKTLATRSYTTILEGGMDRRSPVHPAVRQAASVSPPKALRNLLGLKSVYGRNRYQPG